MKLTKKIYQNTHIHVGRGGLVVKGTTV